MLLLSLAFTIVGSVSLLVLLGRLPDGRACPECGAVPLRRITSPTAGRFTPLAGLVDIGLCSGCGWRGCIRRGPVYKRAGRGGGKRP